MSQTQISYFDASGYVSIPCPQCGEDVYIDMPIFFTAINDFEGIECVDCKFKFYVELDLQDSRGLTLRAADEPDTSSAPCDHVWVSQPVHQCAKCGCSPYDTQTS